MPRPVYGWLAVASLAACLAVPVFYFRGHLGEDSYRGLLAGMSLCWFVFATAWARKGRTLEKRR